MTILPFSRKLFKRQEVMKKRRFFTMPIAWIFTKDKKNYYLKFDEKLARKLYSRHPRKARWF